MNDYHSYRELKYKPRWIAPLLRNAIKEHSVIVITGARQVGKSTLLLNERPFSNWRYFSMDDFNALYQANSDPVSLWSGTEHIVLDEVQKAPKILEAVKLTVDTNPGKYHFILSGSANILLMKKVSETLAGRAIFFTLLPMTLGEINNISPTNILINLFKGEFPKEKKYSNKKNDPFLHMWKGFMPRLIQFEKVEDVILWWEGYVSTFLERDLRQLSQIVFLPDFRRLMEILALRCGQILNQTEISRDSGISQPTVFRYINLLETTCLLERLPAFAQSRTKRLIKSPKITWFEPGLVSFLSGHYDSNSVTSSREAGGIFESMIYLHLRSLSGLLMPKARIYYWRTINGKEVDFVLERGRNLIAVEVKLTKNPKYSDIETLKLFIEEYPEALAGLLVHAGNEVKRFHDKIAAIPWFLLK
ncbi:MAG: ATP-binding protein [Fidelibacterota bacterium]